MAASALRCFAMVHVSFRRVHICVFLVVPLFGARLVLGCAQCHLKEIALQCIYSREEGTHCWRRCWRHHHRQTDVDDNDDVMFVLGNVCDYRFVPHAGDVYVRVCFFVSYHMFVRVNVNLSSPVHTMRIDMHLNALTIICTPVICSRIQPHQLTSSTHIHTKIYVFI